MEEPSESVPDVVAQPEPVRTEYDWRYYEAEKERKNAIYGRRLEWIAVVLFIVNLFMMIELVTLLMDDEGWALSMVAVGIVTSLMFLMTIVLSIFSVTKLSKFTLVIGLVGLMISVVSLGAKLMQYITELNDRFR
jgi:ABC-type siderophore export system fused ATPase/permease subunit